MRTTPSRAPRAIRRTAPGAAAAVAALLLAATPAAAGDAVTDTPEWTLTPGTEEDGAATGVRTPMASSSLPPDSWCASTYGSKVCFQHDGDVVWVLDTAADGMSAIGGVYTDHGRGPEACRNKSGHNRWVKCAKDYDESGRVRLRALRYDGDTGRYHQPEAYSGWLPVDGR
ncbi:hypothetical protein [Streptomyces sudanensis]|uniref:hypothetical protein n=1 Tax=Streptomyces sudanensis TaxID=436397 RepID=UPI0020CEADDE|nr:hypothetical protein [Streptomyces sudanensis]MCP9956268.1 hypothetical protein [Streptomyces sudanensis]MCQ0003104.1 hypothetical protein [Streptomyces sudanensis]